MKKGEISIKISKSHQEILSVLGLPVDVVQLLICHAADGIKRPGSWERGWLIQAFGAEFESLLETDPKCGWHQRPKITFDASVNSNKQKSRQLVP